MLDDAAWASVRAAFPALGSRIHLNAAGMSPLCRPVHAAGQAVLRSMLEDVRGFATGFEANLESARASVARFFTARPPDVAFVGTTSLAMNMLALQLKRRDPGRDEVVTLQDEFPASTVAWQRQGYRLAFVPPDRDNRYDVDRIVSAVGGHTAAVVVSLIQSGTGSRLDAAPLARALSDKGVPCILNATQGAGVVPLDLGALPVSAMVASGNKWLMSGTGAAILYVSPELRDRGFPALAGWRSLSGPAMDNRCSTLTAEARGLELGLGSLVPVMCVKAALEFLETLGTERVYQRVLALSDWLVEALVSAGAELLTPRARSHRAGIVSVRRHDADDWIRRLGERGITVVRRGDNAVRISPHVYNNLGDLQTLMSLW
jgi:cysteine desulfurase / selenocysteine lyase